MIGCSFECSLGSFSPDVLFMSSDGANVSLDLTTYVLLLFVHAHSVYMYVYGMGEVQLDWTHQSFIGLAMLAM